MLSQITTSLIITHLTLSRLAFTPLVWFSATQTSKIHSAPSKLAIFSFLASCHETLMSFLYVKQPNRSISRPKALVGAVKFSACPRTSLIIQSDLACSFFYPPPCAIPRGSIDLVLLKTRPIVDAQAWPFRSFNPANRARNRHASPYLGGLVNYFFFACVR